MREGNMNRKRGNKKCVKSFAAKHKHTAQEINPYKLRYPF
jgi:hypothetical protein